MALTEVYVDPSLDANSGSGTVGDPYGDLRYAIEQTTFDTTNGTRFNIKSGTAEILTENLYTSTQDTGTTIAYVPAVAAPLVFEGYTTTAGDGGIGEINGDATYPIFDGAGSVSYTTFKNLKLHNTGSNYIIYASGAYNNLINCECYNSTGYIRGLEYVFNCYVHDINSTYALFCDNILNCRLDVTASNCAISAYRLAYRNTVIQRGVGSGIEGFAALSMLINNSVYSAGTTNTNTFGMGANQYYNVILNNLVEGWNTSGSFGIKYIGISNAYGAVVGGNAVYDCDTAYNLVKIIDNLGDNETLTASPFTDAANGDFTPVDTGNVKEGSLPNQIGLRT